VRWQKQGLLLPAPPPVPWASSHAAMPIAHPVEDGRLRVYYSARDERGRARIGAADVELGGEAEHLAQPLVDLGALGAFDDSGVTGSCVVDVAGRRYLYYTGWSLGVTVPFYFAIGCAVSDDGGAGFERISAAPVLGRNAVDPFLAASPWILVEDGLWRMWYVSCVRWTLEEGRAKHWYLIRYAESSDGIAWTPTGRVCIDFASAAEYAISRPCVVKDEGLYRMWFGARGDAYRIGYAESEDGLDWRRDDSRAGIAGTPGSWDAEMQTYPAVVDHAGRRYLLYNGDGYGATGIGYARESGSPLDG
jgi:hypothetical protein